MSQPIRHRQTIKQLLRTQALSWLGRSLDIEEMQTALLRLLDRGGMAPKSTQSLLTNRALPYNDLTASVKPPMRQASNALFISSRFRSGSTLLWNLFRQTSGCTAFYEPFNERRFFEPTVRGDNVDQTHKGVSDYWHEYDGLASLSSLYDETWVKRNLYMDGQSWNPAMREFIDTIIAHAPQRAVLQFNRVDFRLPWLRRQYPDAGLLHLYRHPRDQWCSFLPNIDAFPYSAPADQYVDHFYLNNWTRDLQFRFPVLQNTLSEHPYRRFYLLWKLSWLHGQQHADMSISFEALVSDPETVLQAVYERFGIDVSAMPDVKALVQAPTLGRWTRYATSDWFEQHERWCEDALQSWLGS